MMVARRWHSSAFFASPWCLLVAAVFFCAADVSLADAPDVKALMPSGVQRGQTVTVKVLGKAGMEPVQSWCDREQVTVNVGEKGNELTVTAAPETPPGLCWIRLHNAEGASALRPFLIGLLPEVSEEEPNNSVPQAKTVDSTGVTVNGVLHKNGEVDVFAVALEAGQTLVASVESARTLGSPADCVLQVLSPQGFVLEQNDDDHGIDPQIVFPAPVSGKYYVRLFAFPKDPNSTIGFAGGEEYLYRLTLTTGPFIDRLIPAAAADGSTSLLRGWNLPVDAPAAALVVQEESVTGALPFPGTWQLERMPLASGSLVVEPDNVTDPLALPAAVTGHLAADGEIDTYGLQGTKGQSLRIAVMARLLDSPLDPVLKVVDAENKVLKEEDDAGREELDPATTFEIPSDGAYRVQVADRFGHGGERYFYLLTIGEVRPDVALSVEKDAWVLKPGTPLELPVTVVRSGTLPGPPEISIEGVPEGVTLTVGEMTEKPPEGERRGRRRRGRASEGEKTTLKLEAAEGTVFSGPVRIVGTVEGESPLVRTATAPTAAPGIRTRDLWLTVGAK